MTNLILNVNREGYQINQIRNTMTVGELISMLENYDEDTPVYFGNDRRDYGWYTYGGVTEEDFFDEETEDEDEDEYPELDEEECFEDEESED